METIHGDDVHKVAQEVLETKKGIFRLAPNWIPRSWIPDLADEVVQVRFLLE
jgi:hypothetical protein